MPTASLPANSPARAEWIRPPDRAGSRLTGGWPARPRAAAAGPSRASFSHGPTMFSRHASTLAGFQSEEYLHDDLLGYVPRPGYSTPQGLCRARHKI